MYVLYSDDRDSPWVNNKFKELINKKNETFQCYFFKFFKLNFPQMNELKSLIEASKEKYYSCISKRMMNPLISTKTYWSILKSFLNNKKIRCIPPLLHQNRCITKYKDHCVKSVRIWSYSGLYFPAFGLNTDRYKVCLRIQSKCGKRRTRITLNKATFHEVDKTELFNIIFANQYSLINNSSVLPSVLFKRTINVISSINFS